MIVVVRTKILPERKFATSPIYCVFVNGMWIRFLRSSTITPETGPQANPANSAGMSEKSYLRNPGIRGSAISSSMSTSASAVIIPVSAILRIIFFLDSF